MSHLEKLLGGVATFLLVLLLPSCALAAVSPVLHVRKFSSTDHEVSCEVLDAAAGGPSVDCNVFDDGHNGFHSGSIDARGTTTVCNHPPGGRYCGVLGGRFRALPNGRSTEAERFRCSSEAEAIVCIRASGKRAGLGFRIDRDRAVKVHRAPPAPPSPGPGEGAAGVSHAQLWTSLEGQVTCGIFAHYRTPARRLLCAGRSIPPPQDGNVSEGDPGFVLLEATGEPQPTRLSQYSWQLPDGWRPGHQTPLPAGATWGFAPIGVTCAIGETAVTCTNRSGHGFTLAAESYTAF
jgi:hypothetical protein